jgi:mono/diheme cytochrome c family protein
MHEGARSRVHAYLFACSIVVGLAASVNAHVSGASLRAVRFQDDSKVITVRVGVYTEAQSSRGRQQYDRTCSRCHGRDLSGDSEFSPPLAGEDFLARWEGRTMAELFATREVMPPNAPRSIAPESYAEIVAYLLRANGLPAGKQELPVAAGDLDRILIHAK